MKTVRESFDIYHENVIIFRNQSSHTEIQHYCVLNQLMNFLGEDFPIRYLTFEQIRDWKKDLEKRNLSNLTIRSYFIKLRNVLGYMHKQGIPCLDPTSIPLPVMKIKTPGVLTPEEVSRLIAAAKKPMSKVIISLLYSTGLRVSTLCNLDIVDVKNDYFHVKSKGDSDQLCFIDRRTRRLLDAYLSTRHDNNAALFISRVSGRRIKPIMVQDLFKYLRQQAGFDWPVHPHTMRHSYLTNLVMNGAPLHAVQRLAGHKSIATTGRYLHIFDPELKDVHKKYHSLNTRPL